VTRWRGNGFSRLIVLMALAIAVAPWLLPAGALQLAPGPKQSDDRTLPPELQELLNPPQAENFEALVQRPLFAASRRSAEIAPPDTARLLLGRYRISGLLIAPHRRIALLVGPDGKSREVSEGSEVDGWRIAEINARHLLLTRASERLEYPVGADAYPAAGGR
jgi:hypothetical protein